MKNNRCFFYIFMIFLFTACPIGEDDSLPELSLSINKVQVDMLNNYKVAVDETIEIGGLIAKGFYLDKPAVILYIENYPKDIKILKGTRYEPLSTEKYLCIEPVLINKRDGLVKVQMSFSEPGEYIIKVNGFTPNCEKVFSMWGDIYYTYKFTVTEW